MRERHAQIEPHEDRPHRTRTVSAPCSRASRMTRCCRPRTPGSSGAAAPSRRGSARGSPPPSRRASRCRRRRCGKSPRSAREALETGEGLVAPVPLEHDDADARAVDGHGERAHGAAGGTVPLLRTRASLLLYDDALLPPRGPPAVTSMDRQRWYLIVQLALKGRLRADRLLADADHLPRHDDPGALSLAHHVQPDGAHRAV